MFVLISVLYLLPSREASSTGTRTWTTNRSELQTPSSWTERGCNICTCNYGSRTVDCSNIDFRKGLPTATLFPVVETVGFFFTSANVSFIDPGYFLNFPSLQVIHGDYNNLTGPFALPPNTTTLWLSHNCITSVSGFFQRIIYDYAFLGEVVLNYNCMKKIRTGEFSGFPRLRFLSLKYVGSPLILEKGAIANLPLLTKLKLDGNKMTNLSIHTLENLGTKSGGLTLRLSGNNLIELGEDFLMLPDITELEVGRCKIKHLHPNAFRHLRSLNILHMNRNEIVSLPGGLLRNTEDTLASLDLSWNNLNSLSGSAFRSGQQILKLRLHNNLLVEIDESLFETITVFYFLDLSANYLTKLPVSLSRQLLIRDMFLFNNSLTTIKRNAFNGMDHLETLNLMRNNIREIEAGAFNGLPFIKTIYLVENNNLTALTPEVFVRLRNCTIWLNCGQLKTLPQVPKDVDIQCVAHGHGVVVSDVDGRAADKLSDSGFSCSRIDVGTAPDLYKCSECQAGTISPGPFVKGAHCKNCHPGGWYQDEAGKEGCKKCVDGTYVRPDKSPGRSPLDCTVCPTGTNTTLHAGYRACPCLDGYYRLDRFGSCIACDTTSPGLVCIHEYPTVKQGYWWTWEKSNSTNEQERYVNFIQQLEVHDDTYDRSSEKFSGRLPIVYRCPLPDSCQGGTTNYDMCKPGYTGPLCSLCDRDHFSWFNTCQRCPPLWRGVLQLFIIVFLFVFLMFALFKAERLRMTRRKHAATVVDQVASKAKILIGFAQVMAGVLSALAYIPWPSLLLHAGSWLKSVELNVVEMANPTCFSSRLRINELEKTVINIIAQVFLLLSVFFYYRLRYGIVPWCWPRFRPDHSNLSLARRSCLRNSWWILFLCYPSTTAHIMATLPYKVWTCLKICHYDNDGDCPWYLKADPSIQCKYGEDSENKVLFVVCWAMTAYVVCLPLLLLWGLFMRHRSLQLLQYGNYSDDDPFVTVQSRKSSAREDLLKSLEFLDENYHDKFWYWELVEIVRKFLLTCGIEYFGSSSLSGVAIAAIIANVFLLLHAQFKPIKRNSEHWLQLLSLLVIGLSLMFGTLITLQQAISIFDSSTSEDEYDQRVFSIIVLLINGFFALYLFGRIVVSAYSACRRSIANGRHCHIVLCLIYFLSDENTGDSDSVGCRFSTQGEGELNGLTGDA